MIQRWWRRGLLRAAGALVAAVATLGSGIALAVPAHAAAPPLPFDVTQGTTPAVDPNGRFVFSRGQDSSLLFSQGFPASNGFGPFISLGGQVRDSPTGVGTPEGARAFVRGFDNQAYTYLVRDNTTPTGYAVIPGLLISSQITAVPVRRQATGATDVAVFARGFDDGGVYTNLLSSGRWTGWRKIGDLVTSNIQAALIGPETIRVVARRPNMLVENVIIDLGGNVGAWQPVGDLRVLGDVTLTGMGGLPQFRGDEVFARATNGEVFGYDFKVSNPGWLSLGGVATSDIAVSVTPDRGLQYFVRGQDNAIYANRRPFNGLFGGYVRLGGVAVGNPASTGAAPAAGRTADDELVVLGRGGVLYGNIQQPGGAFGGYFAFTGPPHS
ncbi:hypothetical protein DPM19_04745 [Actinomadura craniellae]|uniref:PLL-like beta propeller domain-containing protein n=2 Tax=Actinomadura craniellae TaxID=2231787 RepID=A0A365HB17_9ACTN|nr:hypothetical protein DPM19_04745 [Actinomadura craniellae]